VTRFVIFQINSGSSGCENSRVKLLEGHMEEGGLEINLPEIRIKGNVHAKWRLNL
jgi:hypothetical protein